MKILAVIFLAFGFFLTAVAAIGVLRFPDFYTRMHASGKADTLGVALTLVGLALYEGVSLTSFKILFISANNKYSFRSIIKCILNQFIRTKQCYFFFNKLCSGCNHSKRMTAV
jgi:monovalent cation/proton antiporter MnhG/PhaG subunit